MNAISRNVNFYITGGTLPQDALSYVERQADTDLREGLQQTQFCYVLTSRQMGKSSLMVRTAARLRLENITCIVLDLTAVGQNLSGEQWYDGLLNLVGRQLNLEDELDAFWLSHERLGPLQRWMQAIEEVVLTRISGPIVIFVDEIDTVRSLPFSADEFFAAIRHCYNRRAETPPLRRLTFCLLGVATPSDLIRDTRTTPFNIGRHIELRDFTPEEARTLAVGMNKEMAVGAVLLKRILYWTNGHPYLTQRLCLAALEAEAALNTAEIDRLCETLLLSSRAQKQDDNLQFVRERLIRSEADLASLLSLLDRVQQGRKVPDEEINPLVAILKLSGVVQAVDGFLQLRNRIYARVFNRDWIRSMMPDADLRRQKAAYRKGLLRATCLCATVFLAMTALTKTALDEKRRADVNSARAQINAGRAEAGEQEVRRTLYAANINLAQQAWQEKDYVHEKELLEALKPNTDQLDLVGLPPAIDLRGWEWYFLWQRAHFDLPTLSAPSSYAFVAVAYSPDGKRIATGDGHGSIQLWDAATGQKRREFSHPIFGGATLAFSPDGNILASGGADPSNTVKLWDIQSGKELQTLQAASAVIGFLSEGKILATRYSKDTTLWETATGRKIRQIKGIHGLVVFSPDGKILANRNETGLKLWDMTTNRELLMLDRAEEGWGQNSLAFSPDGKSLAEGAHYEKEEGSQVSQTARTPVKVWDVATGRLLHSYPNTAEPVAFSPDGKTLATGRADNQIVLWDLISLPQDLRSSSARITGREKETFKTATGPIAFSPDGTRLVTQAYDYRVMKVWETARSREPRTLEGTGDYAALSPDGHTLATAGSEGDSVQLRDLQTGRALRTLQGASLPFAFSSDGKTLAAVQYNKPSGRSAIALWDMTTDKSPRLIPMDGDDVLDMTFAPDNSLLAVNRGNVEVWNITTEQKIQSFPQAYGQPVFSPDGKTLVTGSASGLKFWDVASGRETRSLPEATAPVAFSCDGRYMAAAVRDQPSILLWDTVSNMPPLVLTGHKYSPFRLAFSKDGRRLVTGDGGDYTVKLWDTQTGRELFTIPGRTDRTDVASYSLFFSPGGERLITGNQGDKIKIWDSVP